MEGLNAYKALEYIKSRREAAAARAQQEQLNLLRFQDSQNQRAMLNEMAQERMQMAQNAQAERQQQLYVSQLNQARESYNTLRQSYSDLVKALDSGDDKARDFALKQLYDAGSLYGRGRSANPEVSAALANAASIFDEYTKTAGQSPDPNQFGAWWGEQEKANPQLKTKLGNAVPLALQMMQEMAADPAHKADILQAYQQKAGGGKNPYIDQIMGLGQARSTPELRQRAMDFLALPPETVVQGIYKAQFGEPPTPGQGQGGQGSPMDRLAALAQKLPDVEKLGTVKGQDVTVAPGAVAGTIQTSSGTQLVPTAGADPGAAATIMAFDEAPHHVAREGASDYKLERLSQLAAQLQPAAAPAAAPPAASTQTVDPQTVKADQKLGGVGLRAYLDPMLTEPNGQIFHELRAGYLASGEDPKAVGHALSHTSQIIASHMGIPYTQILPHVVKAAQENGLIYPAGSTNPGPPKQYPGLGPVPFTLE